MVKLWMPAGNKEQTNIDIKISSLDTYRAKLLIDLSISRGGLISTEEDLYELESCLVQLKDEAVIVSIGQFGLIQRNCNKVKDLKDQYLSSIENLKKVINDIDKQKEELLLSRDKLATKILRVDFGRK